MPIARLASSKVDGSLWSFAKLKVRGEEVEAVSGPVVPRTNRRMRFFLCEIIVHKAAKSNTRRKGSSHQATLAARSTSCNGELKFGSAQDPSILGGASVATPTPWLCAGLIHFANGAVLYWDWRPLSNGAEPSR